MKYQLYILIAMFTIGCNTVSNITGKQPLKFNGNKNSI